MGARLPSAPVKESGIKTPFGFISWKNVLISFINIFRSKV